MIRYAFLSILILISLPAHAEAVPEYVLDHDYVNCMGGEATGGDPERAAYCNCVRDGMRSWDVETYGSVAMAEQKAGSNTQQIPDKLSELAKGCIQKVLK